MLSLYVMLANFQTTKGPTKINYVKDHSLASWNAALVTYVYTSWLVLQALCSSLL